MPPYNKRQKTNNSSLNPIRLQTSLCAVECEDEDGFEFCYIQPSQDLSRDLMHHLQGSGSPYTQTYKPTGKVGIKLFVTDVEAESKALAEEYKAKDFSVFSEMEQTDAYIAQCMRMRLAPVDLLVQTYVLECEPLANCTYTGRYIGNTQNLSLRIPHHFNRTGANWTKLHKPIGVFEVICDAGTTFDEARVQENETTLQYMREFIDKYGPDGWRSVRGGEYLAPNMQRPIELKGYGEPPVDPPAQ